MWANISIFLYWFAAFASPATALNIFRQPGKASPPRRAAFFDHKRVAIVGAGPVGLYTAERLVNENTSPSVLILDKQPEYLQRQVVTLSGWKPPKYDTSKVLGEFRISQIHRELKKRLQTRPTVSFEDGEFTDLGGLTDKFYSAGGPDAVIFADGAESKARDTFFGGANISESYASECSAKYRRALGLTAESLRHSHTYRISKLTDTQIFQSVKDQEKVSLVVVGKYTHDQLRQKLNVLINARRVELGERLVTSPEINCTDLQVKIANSVHQKLGDLDLFLVGDAAATLPYQVGLSTGFSTADILAKNPSRYNELAREFFFRMQKVASWKFSQNKYSRWLALFSSKTSVELHHWREDYEKLLLTTDDVRSNFILEHPLTKNRKFLFDKVTSLISKIKKIFTERG